MSTPLIESMRRQQAAVVAVLQTLRQLLDASPAAQRDRYFAVLRSMLLYLGEYHETFQAPIESDILFPHVAAACPELKPIVQLLRAEGMQHESRVRDVQHLLNGWEMIGEARRARLIAAAQIYVAFYLRYLRMQEMHLIGPAEIRMSADSREAMDRAFAERWPALAAEDAATPARDGLPDHLVVDMAPFFEQPVGAASH